MKILYALLVLPSQKEYTRARKHTENAAGKTLGTEQILYEKKLNRLGLCLRKWKIEEMRQKIVNSWAKQ